MGRIVGIDLGTTNTAVAVMQDGRPRVIEDDRGYKVLPSVVSARGEGRFIVGQAASSLILTHPDRTVYATKRLIGRRYDSPEVQRAKARMHYEIRQAPDGGVQVRVGDEWMSPAEVAAVILQVGRSIAEKALGDTVEEAVITVPAHFNHQQRAQTMEAAHIAGLRCERLLNEPTAAALAYGHRKNVEKTLLVFDLGGGTFDVSVLRLAGGIFETLATAGDTYLGGEDFDYRLVDHLADAFQTRTGIDLRADRSALQRLKDASERAKCELSFSDRTTVIVPQITPTETLQQVVTRQTLEQLTSDLVQRCVDVARQTVSDASLGLSDIDDVILVGGQTRMPRVRELVSGVFGREPSRTVHPEEAVAVGAAVHASSLADGAESAAILLDVTPFDLGIDSAGGMFTPVIQKNARIPAAESRTFATVTDNQTMVRVTVRQGESRVAVENEFLGEFVVENLPPAPRLKTKVDITFRIDNNGMLNVSATEKASGARTAIVVRNYAEHAQTPRLPSREEADAERVARAASPTGDLAALPKPDAAAAENAKKKGGLLSNLFGGGGKKKKAEKVVAPVAAAAAAASTPAPVPANAAEPAAAATLSEPEPMDLEPAPTDMPSVSPTPAFGFRPAIDLSEIPVAGLEDTLDMATDAPLAGAAPLDDEDLFATSEGPASFGLAGSSPTSAGPTLVGLDMDDLFGGTEPQEDTADPDTDNERRRESFGFDGDESMTDPFARPPPTNDLYLPGHVVDEPAPEDGGFALMEDEPAEPPTNERRGLFFHGLIESPTEAATSFAPPPDDDDEPAPGELLENESDLPSGGFGEISLGGLDNLFDSGTIEEAKARQHPTLGPDPTSPDADPFGFGLPAPPPAPRAPTTVISAPMLLGGIAEETAAPRSESHTAPKKAKKPARLKLHYREREAFVAEYRENLRRGGTFIRTEKPLSIGRECVFEIDAPGLVEPIVFDAVVAAVSQGHDGSPTGMTVEYRLDGSQRDHIERVLSRL